MAALTDNKKRVTQDTDISRSPYHGNVAVSVEVFRGALLYLDSADGLLKLAPSATTRFMGVSPEYYLNNTGGTTTTFPVVAESGHLEQVTLSGAAETAVGDLLHGTTDDALTTLTAGAATNPLGHIERYVTTDTVLVRCERLAELI